MQARPAVGSKITVIVNNVSHEPVFVPLWNRFTVKSPDTNTYCGTVVKPDPWLRNDEFNLTTELKHFPVRTITMERVISIEGAGGAKVIAEVTKTVNIKGSKGNIYDVVIRNGIAQSCTCPGFHYRGGRCKHLQMATS